MTQQLRLVQPPESPQHPAKGRFRATTAAASAKRRLPRAARSTTPRARRAASWGEWALDSRTRSVGKAGVAAARQALEQAAARAHVVENHRQAS